MLTPKERTLRAKIGALTLHSSRDSREITANARAAFLSRFERDVDPNGVLTLAERQRRAVIAKKLYFTRLALTSSRARSRKSTRRVGR